MRLLSSTVLTLKNDRTLMRNGVRHGALCRRSSLLLKIVIYGFVEYSAKFVGYGGAPSEVAVRG